MEKLLTKNENIASFGAFLCFTLLGCGLITLGALVKIPFYPISFTLHTFAIALLGLTQSPRQAVASVLCYLAFATMGLPILSGGLANPLWFTAKAGGYYMAFPFAAYLISKLSQKGYPFLGLICGQILILALGSAWLSFFIGAKLAFIHGALFFLPSDTLKNLIALVLIRKVWQIR